MTKSFHPSMNLTDIFSLNKNLHIPTFEKKSINTTYDTNFGKNYNKDFSRKVIFDDDSKSLINNTKLFENDFHRKDNTNELTNLIKTSESQMTELNPQYKYRFPQYTEDEFKLMQWQTQEGTPNELNQRLRSDVNNANIEDIKRDDDNYESGLQTLKEKMRERKKQLYKIFEDVSEANRNDNSITPSEKELIENKLEIEKENREAKYDKKIRKYKKTNPVLIKPVISTSIPTPKSPKTPTPKSPKTPTQPSPKTPTQPSPVLSTPSPASAQIPSMTPTKSRPTTPAPDGVEESKTTEPIKANTPKIKKTSPITISNPEEEKKLAKVQLFLKSKNAKKILEEKRKSINTNPDDNTVVETLSTPTETYKVNMNSYKTLLNNYKDLPNNATIDDFNTEDKVKITGYMQFLGINLNTKKLEKLREKSKHF